MLSGCDDRRPAKLDHPGWGFGHCPDRTVGLLALGSPRTTPRVGGNQSRPLPLGRHRRCGGPAAVSERCCVCRSWARAGHALVGAARRAPDWGEA
jgi:hypothetical protein